MTALLFKLDKETKKIKSQLPTYKFSPEELKEIRKKQPGAKDFYWLDEDGGKIFQVYYEDKDPVKFCRDDECDIPKPHSYLLDACKNKKSTG